MEDEIPKQPDSRRKQHPKMSLPPIQKENQKKDWLSLWDEEEHHSWVVPRNDIIEHQTYDEHCICGPYVEEIHGDDNIISVLVVHHSLDGRELNE